MRIRHIAPLVGLVCLAVAGCTKVSGGDPTPVPTGSVSSTGSASSSSGSGDDLPSNGAPKVKDPLDASRFEQDPCSILTAAQTRDLNVPATGKKRDGTLGLDCEWRNPDTRGWVTIGFLTNNHRGLSAAYARNQSEPYAYFTPLSDIEGYPAIASDIVDRRSEGVCIVYVGVTDQLIFSVAMHLSPSNVGTTDPCELGADVAGMALRTIKEGA